MTAYDSPALCSVIIGVRFTLEQRESSEWEDIWNSTGATGSSRVNVRRHVSSQTAVLGMAEQARLVALSTRQWIIP